MLPRSLLALMVVTEWQYMHMLFVDYIHFIFEKALENHCRFPRKIAYRKYSAFEIMGLNEHTRQNIKYELEQSKVLTGNNFVDLLKPGTYQNYRATIGKCTTKRLLST